MTTDTATSTPVEAAPQSGGAAESSSASDMDFALNAPIEDLQAAKEAREASGGDEASEDEGGSELQGIVKSSEGVSAPEEDFWDGTKDEVRAEAEKALQLRNEKLQQRQYAAHVEQFFNESVNGLRSELSARGVPREVAEHFVQRFANHNKVAEAAAFQRHYEFLTHGYTESMLQNVSKAFGANVDLSNLTSTPDLLKRITKAARAGYVSNADAEARTLNALTDYKARLDKLGATPGSRALKDSAGPGVSGPKVGSLEWAKNAPIKELLKHRSVD